MEGKDLKTPNKVQELQRKLYLKAKSEKNFRFYALYDKLYRYDVLQEAWRRVKVKHSAPGIDGLTVEKIKERGEEQFLGRIEEELKKGTYLPQSLRRVSIPKKDQGKRPLSIPTLKDRVVQMSLKLTIEPIFEADFEECSYGYRPKRSAQQAALEVRKYLNYGLDKVIEVDIENCFAEIPHQELLQAMRRRVVDGKILRLIKLFLKAKVMEEHIRKTDKGIPQGGVISPLLCNIYLDALDKGWVRKGFYVKMVRYADDLVIMTKYQAEKFLRELKENLSKLKLKVKEAKTRTLDAKEETFDFLGFEFKKAWTHTEPKRRAAIFFPSHKSELAIKEKIRKVTNPSRPLGVERVVEELNPVLRGWVNYFRIANSSKKLNKVKYYAANKVRKFIRRRQIKRGYGYKKYPESYLYEVLGLYKDYGVRWVKAFR